MFLLILIILVPIIEIALFAKAGALIGVWSTIFLTIATTIAGTSLLRMQGWTVFQKARTQVGKDKFPLEELFNGLCLFAAGIFLLIPGFMTDTIGLLLFTPPVRHLAFLWLKNNKNNLTKSGFSTDEIFKHHSEQQKPSQHRADQSIIEGTFKTVNDKEKDNDNGN
ncbi:MAG: FxsA family protein [Gammaproteobacteria bacterium]|nr:FxsA family protein [Gammaproteobacteria bacterium]